MKLRVANIFRAGAAWALIPLATAVLFGQAAWAQSATAARPGAAAHAATTGTLVDINAASMAELKSIPGIGDAYANKIVAGRPYKSKAQLKSRNILPERVYEQAKDRIVAKQK